jgi:hypothetical protein
MAWALTTAAETFDAEAAQDREQTARVGEQLEADEVARHKAQDPDGDKCIRYKTQAMHGSCSDNGQTVAFDRCQRHWKQDFPAQPAASQPGQPATMTLAELPASVAANVPFDLRMMLEGRRKDPVTHSWLPAGTPLLPKAEPVTMEVRSRPHDGVVHVTTVPVDPLEMVAALAGGRVIEPQPAPLPKVETVRKRTEHEKLVQDLMGETAGRHGPDAEKLRAPLEMSAGELADIEARAYEAGRAAVQAEIEAADREAARKRALGAERSRRFRQKKKA